MGELVGEQASSALGVRGELAGGEEDVAADGEGAGLQATGERPRLAAGVNADVGEVGTEPLLHLPPHALRQRLPRAAERLDARLGGRVHGLGARDGGG